VAAAPPHHRDRLTALRKFFERLPDLTARKAAKASQNRRAALASRRGEANTSMTCPAWSIAQYT
jgi:hypothetical protein